MVIRNNDGFNRSLPAKFDGVFNWDDLRWAFRYDETRIEPFDTDAKVERRGHLLCFETKADESVPIPNGQRRAIEAEILLGYRGSCSYIILPCKSLDYCERWQYWRLSRDAQSVVKRPLTGTKSAFLHFCRDWFDWATSHPLIDANGRLLVRQPALSQIPNINVSTVAMRAVPHDPTDTDGGWLEALSKLRRFQAKRNASSGEDDERYDRPQL